MNGSTNALTGRNSYGERKVEKSVVEGGASSEFTFCENGGHKCIRGDFLHSIRLFIWVTYLKDFAFWKRNGAATGRKGIFGYFFVEKKIAYISFRGWEINVNEVGGR